MEKIVDCMYTLGRPPVFYRANTKRQAANNLNIYLFRLFWRLVWSSRDENQHLQVSSSGQGGLSAPGWGCLGTLLQVEEFKYLKILFVSKGRAKRKTDKQISSASAVMQKLYYSWVQRRSWSIYWSIYPFLLSPMATGCRIVTEEQDCGLQAVEMSFVHTVVWAHPLLGALGGAQSRAAAPLHQKEPAEVVYVSLMSSRWCVPGMLNMEDIHRQTQDMLESILCHSYCI